MDSETNPGFWTQLWLFPDMRGTPKIIDITGHNDSEEDWETAPTGWEHQIWEDARTFYTVMAMFDFEADRRGWALNEIRFQRKDDGRVLAIMKASKGNRKVVAFVGGETFFECFKEVQETKKREGFEWKPDKYAKF